MASIALPALFSFLAPTAAAPTLAGISAAGAFAGQVAFTALGAYIDSAYIIPAIFPLPDTEGPRLNDLKFQGDSEGQAVNQCYGQSVRTAGHLLWQSDLIEHKTTQSSGAKGGGGGDFISYTYAANAAVMVCWNEIEDITKIRANGQVIYDVDVDYSISSTQLSSQPDESMEFKWNGTALCDSSRTTITSSVRAVARISGHSHQEELQRSEDGQTLT